MMGNKNPIPAYKQRVDLSNILFDLFTGIMNEIHESDFSPKFYRILLEDHVRVIVDRRKEFESEIVALTPDNYSLRYPLIKSTSEKLKRKLVMHIKYLLYRRNQSKRRDTFRNYDHITFEFSGVPGISENSDYHELQSFIPLLIGKGDHSKRKLLSSISERYDDPFIKNSILLLPTFAVEHFEKIYNQIILTDPEKKTFHSLSLRFFEYDSIFVAKYIENGARLIWYQNGAECAEFHYQYARHHQYSISDEYRTWGWERDEKDVPWVAYPLLKFQRDYNASRKEKKFDYMLCFPKINSENREFFKECTQELLKNVKKENGYTFLARPHPTNRKKSHAGQLDFIDDERVTVSSGLTSIIDDMSICETIIQMEIASTNFLECICVNQPSLGLLLNKHPTEIIKPYYRFFLKQNVFHENIQSMAYHINNVNIKTFWSSLLKNENMAAFKRTFVNIDA